jgi:hypothetical protein
LAEILLKIGTRKPEILEKVPERDSQNFSQIKQRLIRKGGFYALQRDVRQQRVFMWIRCSKWRDGNAR